MSSAKPQAVPIGLSITSAVDGSIAGRPVDYLRSDNTIATHVEFIGPGLLDASAADAGTFVQDNWTPRKGLRVDVGARFDYAGALSSGALGPRAREVEDRIHVCRLAIEMNRQHCFGSRGDGTLNEPGIEVEISVLTPMKRLVETADFRVNIHGGFLKARGRQGLLLPQVAAGRDWSAGQFLEALARKAGLSTDALSDPVSRLYVFRAQVIPRE